MKALVFEKYGSPDVLELCEVDKPVAKDHEVLVKVSASSINSWDWELLQGKQFVNRLMFGLLKPNKINILDCDIAGRIEAIGNKVTKFQTGDDVYGDVLSSTWGGFDEYCCAPENTVETCLHDLQASIGYTSSRSNRLAEP